MKHPNDTTEKKTFFFKASLFELMTMILTPVISWHIGMHHLFIAGLRTISPPSAEQYTYTFALAAEVFIGTLFYRNAEYAYHNIRVDRKPTTSQQSKTPDNKDDKERVVFKELSETITNRLSHIESKHNTRSHH